MGGKRRHRPGHVSGSRTRLRPVTPRTELTRGNRTCEASWIHRADQAVWRVDRIRLTERSHSISVRSTDRMRPVALLPGVPNLWSGYVFEYRCYDGREVLS